VEEKYKSESIGGMGRGETVSPTPIICHYMNELRQGIIQIAWAQAMKDGTQQRSRNLVGEKYRQKYSYKNQSRNAPLEVA